MAQLQLRFFSFFFFNDTAPTQIYTLSLHDALPIWAPLRPTPVKGSYKVGLWSIGLLYPGQPLDRKSTRLNSSHLGISYAVFCLKKKRRKESSPNVLDMPGQDTVTRTRRDM